MGKKGAQAMEKNPNWKGGRSVASNGYVLVKRPDHHRADVRGYVYEHVLVAEETIGRKLVRGEEVHHKNGVRDDNAPENLVVKKSHAEHGVEHRKRGDLRLPGEDNPAVVCSCGCGTELAKYDRSGRPRRYISGHNTRGR